MPINAWLIALDKTHEYNIDAEDALHIEKVEGVYLFDRNQVTHCGSTEPFYDLRYLYTIITVVDGLSDKRREELEEKYAYETGNDCYAHTKLVDSIIEEGDPSLVEQYGDPGVAFENVEYDDQMYAVGEHYVCNRPL